MADSSGLRSWPIPTIGTATTSSFSPEKSSHVTIPRNLELYKFTSGHDWLVNM